MKIGFNPAIKNQNLYNTKRNASEHISIPNNQLAFKKVNQEFYKMAEESFKDWKDVTSEWYEWFTDAVALWKDIPKQDAIDTLDAIRKWVHKDSLESYNATYNFIKSLVK